MALDGLAEGQRSEGVVVGLGASVGHGVENGEANCVSSKMPRSMDEME